MECSFWNMTFVISEDARVLSDWAVNYDYNFSVTSCSLSISRRGNLRRTIEFAIASAPWWPWRLLSGSDAGTLLPRWHCLPCIPTKRFLLSARWAICTRHHLSLSSGLYRETIQFVGLCPMEDKQDKGHVLQSPGVWRHMACSQNSKKQHWIGKWPSDYREVECCFCLHKIDCFKFINYIKNAEEVSYLPGQISFPGCLYSAYIIEKVYI